MISALFQNLTAQNKWIAKVLLIKKDLLNLMTGRKNTYSGCNFHHEDQ